MEIERDEIIDYYSSYVYCILTAIQDKGVKVSNLRSFLLNQTAFQPGCKEQCLLLSDVKPELDRADTINQIIDLLSTKCASFLNFKIFQSLVKEYKITEPEGKESLKYPEYLEAYIKRHKISEFAKINPALNKVAEEAEKLTLKFNIEVTCKVARIISLKSAIIKILKLRASALRLIDIEEGCALATFSIPKAAAKALFGKGFSESYRKQLQELPIIWLECCGTRLNFMTQQDNQGI